MTGESSDTARARRRCRAALGAACVPTAAVLLAATVFAAQASADSVDDPYGQDPLGLIAHMGLSQELATGVDRWQVWLCDVPEGSVQIDLPEVVSRLNEVLTGYFAWLSTGLYTPEFAVGQRVEGATSEDCLENVAAAAGGAASSAANKPNGVIVVDDSSGNEGVSTPGQFCTDRIEITWCSSEYPDNRRSVYVGGGSVTAVEGDSSTPLLSTVAHEIGHALTLPHSYGGIITASDVHGVDSDEPWEYDNPTDIMSGAYAAEPDVGTIAVNRYASGWMDARSVAVHDFSVSEAETVYTLRHPHAEGTRMLVVPSGVQGTFTMFGGRWALGYDRGLEGYGVGVEAYRVDQSGCGDAPCWGQDRRTATLPGADAEAWALSRSAWPRDLRPLAHHIYRQDEEFRGDGWTLRVLGMSDEGFWLVAVGADFDGSFSDDDGSVHEPAIDYLAEAGITSGCDSVAKAYCPGEPVSRYQMAVLLLRALGETPSAAATSRFTDVDDSAWYMPYLERIAELGVTLGYPDGAYRPHEPVTRAQMALFLARAFQLHAAAPPDEAKAFADVAPGDAAAAAISAISSAGITQGCSTDPVRYCPDDILRRGAMATFLHRALLLQAPDDQEHQP